MGIVETMEVFSLFYDYSGKKFHLSLCYADGKILTSTYDIMEYCNWEKEEANWNISDVTKTIIEDIEGRVPLMLFQE